MAQHYLSHLTGDSVRDAQRQYYGRVLFPVDDPAGRDPLGPEEIAFIRRRDSFYLASLSETGWPYVQHRGGPPGFLHVLSPSELAFADVRGNRQMLSAGNTGVQARVSLFLMDYARRERLKLLALARFFDVHERPDLTALVTPESWREKVERVVTLEVISYDWNCPKYITPRYTAAEVAELTQELRARIVTLEAEKAALSRS